MATLHLDFETKSRADLKKVGAFRYANDPSTEILCVAVAKDDQEPCIWIHDRGDMLTSEFAASSTRAELMIEEISTNPDTVVYAHNAMFEIAISDALWQKTFRCRTPRHTQWRCTAAMGRRAALPASLKKLAEALNLGEQKDTRGAALIRKFSVPQKDGRFIDPADDPDAFREFCEYCRQDVRVEQEIHKKLKAFELKGFPLQTFQLDIAINTRGFPVNLEALHRADKLVEEESEKLATQFRALTGVEHTQNARFLEWLKERGFKHNNLQAATMEEVLEDEDFDDTTELGKALMIKKRISFASLKKIPAMIACAGPHDNRVRGTLVWHGTGPGRWSASLVQPQNFKRPTIDNTEQAYRDIQEGATLADLGLCYGPPLEVISSSIRHFIDDNGRGFLNADYSAIQARTVCWLAGEESALQEYRNGVDRYCGMASKLYGRPINKYDHAFPERFIGKQIVLGCGFGMGGPKFRATCEKLGYKDLPKGLEHKAIETFREEQPNTVALWSSLENAAKSAIRNPGQVYPAGQYLNLFCTQAAGMKYLCLKLPSGRCITYPDPKLEKQVRWREVTGKQEYPDGTSEPIYTQYAIVNPSLAQVEKAKKKDPKARISETITFYGQITGKAIWGRITTYGGKLAENATMGVETDMMHYGLITAEEHGYEVCSVIHDEALSYLKPGQTIEEFMKHLTTLPDWAEGLPVIAEGSVIPFYKK